MKSKALLLLIIGSIIITSCGNNQNREKEANNLTEATSIEKSNNENPIEAISKSFKDISRSVFGKAAETDVNTIMDNNGKEKATKVNVTYSIDITTSDKDAIDPFLVKVFSYLNDVKEQALDYESIFFVYKTKSSNGEYKPLVKMEITKEQADDFDFNSRRPQDLISIAKTYESPESKLSNSNINKDALRSYFISQTQSDFSEFCDVKAEVKDNALFIHLYPKDDLANEILQYLAGDRNASIDKGWDTMTSGLLSDSKAYFESVGENISFALHNPVNEENILFSTLNGMVHYNVKNDLKK